MCMNIEHSLIRWTFLTKFVKTNSLQGILRLNKGSGTTNSQLIVLSLTINPH